MTGIQEPGGTAKTFPAEVMATQMPDGALLGMVRDISERKRAESAARHLVAIVEPKAALMKRRPPG